MKQQALIRQFENDNEVYNKIRKIAEEKVHSVLSDTKELLRRAVLCVMESIRKDPGRYSPLIYYNDTTNTSSISTTAIAEYYNTQYYPSYTYGGGAQQQQQYCLTKDSFKQAYIDMLREEAGKLFTSLEKMLVDETIDEHIYKTSVATSLPMLSLEQQQ